MRNGERNRLQVDETYTDYEKALWLHDYMIDNFSYDYNYSSYSSLSMLDNKKVFVLCFVI